MRSWHFLQIILFATAHSLSRPANAEYRVFQLRIYKIETAKTNSTPAESPDQAPGTNAPTPEAPAKNGETKPEELSFREELSTLDPEQYRGYFPVGPDEVVKYVATWRCFGRTNGRDLCPNPKLAQQNPDQPK